MKQTVLELVQDILLEMNSFDVNSISDTLEAEQVASIVRNTYFDIIQQRDWAHLRKAVQLDSATSGTPTHMQVPAGVKKVERILYDTAVSGRARYTEMRYLTPEQFLRNANSLDNTASYVQEVQDPGGITLFIRNDKVPMYWTSFDDQYIVFNSYDSSVDTFLVNSKTQALVVCTPAWEHDDDFYPVLPEEAFPYLLAEAKSRAFLAVKGVPNDKAEQASNRLRRIMSQKHWTLNSGDRYPDYSRQVTRTRNPYMDRQ